MTTQTKPWGGEHEMVQRDYILQMIEMIGVIALHIKRMLRAGKVNEAKQALREAQEQAGVDLDMARTLDGGSLLAIISPGGLADPTRCMLFGEVLYLDGLCALEAGEDELGRENLAKARLLLESAVGYGTAIGVRYPEVDDTVAEINELLDGGTGSEVHDE